MLRVTFILVARRVGALEKFTQDGSHFVGIVAPNFGKEVSLKPVQNIDRQGFTAIYLGLVLIALVAKPFGQLARLENRSRTYLKFCDYRHPIFHVLRWNRPAVGDQGTLFNLLAGATQQLVGSR